MEDFTADDAWAITKMIQLSKSTKRKKEQIDSTTKHRMLTQWDWWHANYMDDPKERPKNASLGPTRQLMDSINQDPLIRKGTYSETFANERKLQRQQSLEKYRYESNRAHQLALTNAATSKRMMETEDSDKGFLRREMNDVKFGVVSARVINAREKQTLRSTMSALSVLDFFPGEIISDRLPSISPSNTTANFNKPKALQKIHVKYLYRGISPDTVDSEKSSSSLHASVASSKYTPDLDSMSSRNFPMTLESLIPTHTVINAKSASTLWINPANTESGHVKKTS